MIKLFHHVLHPEAIENVTAVLRSGWTGLGEVTAQFEKEVASYLNTPHVVALNSGTAALQIALATIQASAGSYIITTPLTFISGIHSIIHAGFIPIFADIEPETGNIDPKSIEKLLNDPFIAGRVKAIMVVHYGGLPIDMDAIYDISNKYNIDIIEDACLLENSLIMSSKGLIKISDIKIDDKVYTHNGNYRAVTKLFKRSYSGDLLTITSRISLPLTLTPDHRIYAKKVYRCDHGKGRPILPTETQWSQLPNVIKYYDTIDWLPAKNLNIGDFISYPIRKLSDNNLININLSDYYDKSYVIENNKIRSIQDYTTDGILNSIQIDYNFLKLCGLFIAEGCISDDSVIWTTTNPNIAKFIENTIIDNFDKIPSIQYQKGGINNRTISINIRINSTILANIFFKWFGKLAYNKIMPSWIYKLSQQQLYSILRGMYTGDGSFSITKRSKLSFRYFTTSVNLAYQLIDILLSLNCVPTLSVRHPNNKYSLQKRDYYIISISNWKYKHIIEKILNIKITINKYKHDSAFIYRNRAYIPIKHISKQYLNTHVYNIEVENDNSYIAEMQPVHNCHAFGAEYQGEKIGCLHSKLVCFSLHSVKPFAIGDGGLLATHDPNIDKLARQLRWCGIDKSTSDRTTSVGYSWDYDVKCAGFKNHMNDIQAAIGLGQLKHYEEDRRYRQALVNKYRELLDNIEQIELLKMFPNRVSSNHLFVIKVPIKLKEKLMQHLYENEIGFGCHYRPSIMYKMYQRAETDDGCKCAIEFFNSCISLPLHIELTNSNIEYVCEKIKEGINKYAM